MCRPIGSECQHTFFMHDIIHRQQCKWSAGNAVAYIHAFYFGDGEVEVCSGKFRARIQGVEECDDRGYKVDHHASDDGRLF